MTLNFGTEQYHHQNHLLQSGLLRTNYGDICDSYYGFQTEAGKSADPRIMRLIEFFRELYIRRKETFKKIVPQGLHDEFIELFKKISSLLTSAKANNREGMKTMQRSLSAGSELRLNRFKVRTVNVGNGGGGSGSSDAGSIGQDGQGDKAKVVAGSK